MICIFMIHSRNPSSTGSSKNKNWQPKHQLSTNVNSNYSNSNIPLSSPVVMFSPVDFLACCRQPQKLCPVSPKTMKMKIIVCPLNLLIITPTRTKVSSKRPCNVIHDGLGLPGFMFSQFPFKENTPLSEQ